MKQNTVSGALGKGLRFSAIFGVSKLHTIDGSEILQQLIGTLSHYSQSFIHPRWFSRRISEPSTVSQSQSCEKNKSSWWFQPN